jgi:hypothetical protein
MAKIIIQSNSGETVGEFSANAWNLRSSGHAFISAGALLRELINAIDEALDKDINDEHAATKR